MASIFGMMTGTVAKAAASVASKAAASAASSSQKSSSGSSGVASGSGGGGSSSPSYGYVDSDGRKGTSNTNTDFASTFGQAQTTEQKQQILNDRLNKMGGNADSWQRLQQGALNDAIAERNRSAAVATDYQQATNNYMDEYAKQQEALRAEQAAKVQQNIGQLDAQRPLVQQAGQQANAAAQQNYYGVVNPNGAAAEQRAALGLSNSGLTESSQIAAGNAYGNAVNTNNAQVQEQLRQIDLAKTQAQLTGDIATAQQLQGYYNTVLSTGMQAAGNVAQLNQWGIENGQGQTQQGVQNGLAEAGLTGIYNGQQTLAGQAAAQDARRATLEFESMDLQNKLSALTLLIQQTYGMKQSEAELTAQTLANSGQSLTNTYQTLQNQYASRNMR